MDLRPELTLSRWENVCRSPGIVLAIAGYTLAVTVSPLVQIGFIGTSIESPLPRLYFSSVSVFCAVWVFKLILNSDRLEITALRIFLLFGAIAAGASDVFGKIEYPSSSVENSPRFVFSDYVATLAMASLHSIMMLVWLALLSAPSVRRWVHSGVRTNEEALELLSEKRKRTEGNLSSLVESEKIKQHGSFRGRIEKGKLIRVCSYLCFGFFPFVAIAYVALVVGRPVPSPRDMSFESLMDQLETKDHWQLRVRREVNHYVSSEILHYSDATKAKMPPSSVPELRLEAVMGLADSGTQAVKPLLSVLSESDEKIRIEAARSLGVIGSDANEALPSLRAMLLDPDLPSSSESRLWQKGSLRHEVASSLVQINPQ
jgi:hypothetical protein